MQFRRLGKTDITVSVVGIGAWQFGGEWGKDYTQREVDEIVAAGKESGINLIDTAECYGDHLSERLVGEAVKSERDQWVIATKFGHKFTGRFEREQLWSADDVRAQLEDSLRALQTDYVDLYQFHSGGNDVFDNDDLWTMLDKQVQAGKVRNLGISVGGSTQDYQTSKADDVNARAIQVVYNRLQRSPEDTVIPTCEKLDLGILARVPLASGFLSGKYKPGDTFKDTDVRSRRSEESVRETLEKVEKIKKEEVPEGVPMARWALAWCLRKPAVTCVIPGCKNPDQVRANASAADLEMVP